MAILMLILTALPQIIQLITELIARGVDPEDVAIVVRVKTPREKLIALGMTEEEIKNVLG